MREFGRRYSRYYDALYSEKNYDKECDYLEALFAKFSKIGVRRVLDVACGTGGHAIPLAKRGYDILGRDLSGSMLALARKKVKAAGLGDKVRLQKLDMRSFQEIGKFDACICMFAAIGYLPHQEEVLDALRTMRKYLKAGGLLVFDCWNGLAVLTLKPSRRVREIHQDGLTMTRSAIPQLDSIRNLCKVKYEIVVNDDSRETTKFWEMHTMRYFYPEDIKFLLKLSRFKLVSFHPFLKPTRKVGARDWNVTTVAVAEQRDPKGYLTG